MRKEIKDKRKIPWWIKKGVENPSKTQKVKEKISKANTGKNLGENNPAKRIEVRKKISKANKGLIKSKEHRQKISESKKVKVGIEKLKKLINKNLYCNEISKILNISPAIIRRRCQEYKLQLKKDTRKNINRIQTKETCEKVSNSLKESYQTGRIQISGCAKLSKESDFSKGKNNPMWKDGKSFEEYTEKWTNVLKETIRIRDNKICQICNTLQNNKKSLCVHHIDYDKKNCDENNLIGLCRSCHTKTNVRREYWEWQLKVFMNLFNGSNHELNMKYNNQIKLKGGKI